MMKKYLFWILAVLILMLYVCAGGLSEEDEDYAFWEMTESSELTEEARAAFDMAAEELTDAVYEPVALLGQKENVFCILCRARGDYEDAKPYYTLVYVGENGVQNIWDLWIEDHSLPKEEETREIDISALISDLVAAREAGALVKADLEALQDDQLAAYIAEKWTEIYMNPDYRLYILGKDDPACLPVSGKHAFVVLGFELENGEMSDELKARCDAAAAAAGAFPESFLVCSGGATGENNPDAHTEAGLMKDYLIREHGIAEERILIDESALTSLDNAVNAFVILKEQEIETITIVTSSYHQQRANMLFELLAEIVREKEGFSVAIAGNYSCEIPVSEDMVKYDAQIAAMQLNEMLTALIDPVQ